MEKTRTYVCHDHQLVEQFLKTKKLEAPVSLRNKNDDQAKRYRIDSGERRCFFNTPTIRRDLNEKISKRRTDDEDWKTSGDEPIKSKRTKNVIVQYKRSPAFNKYNNKIVPHQQGRSTKSEPEYRCEKTHTRKRTFERDMKLGDKVSVSDGAISGEVLAIQLSPKKALRDASLKKRFADTIMKAQQKTSDHAKMEKERFEKKQREEKTRIEGEYRAAAAQTRRAVESRRQRQKEREAARIALQMVEKTVEIDENRYIIKELVMLSGLSPSDLESSAASQNPLERLGLFLKSNYLGDEEEEEEEMILEGECAKWFLRKKQS